MVASFDLKHDQPMCIVKNGALCAYKHRQKHTLSDSPSIKITHQKGKTPSPICFICFNFNEDLLKYRNAVEIMDIFYSKMPSLFSNHNYHQKAVGSYINRIRLYEFVVTEVANENIIDRNLLDCATTVNFAQLPETGVTTRICDIFFIKDCEYDTSSM
jgi:hypothetical protein